MTADSQKSSISAGTSASTNSARRHMVPYILHGNAMIGSYRIEKALGRGGMGEVYLARHVTLNIFRAIKILLPSIAEKDQVYAKRFMNEARLAIVMRHQNIINVMDANYDDRYGVYYIVMEYVDGASIRKIIKEKGRFEEQEALKIVLKVAEALQSAEKLNIVHRDIKPDNIMITSDGEVKLADLGIAKSNSGSDNIMLTNPQMMLGTIAYVSPEQASDAQSVDCRADIYSLGVTLYEMLAAEKPYTGTRMEILRQVFSASVPNIREKVPSVTAPTAKLLKKMMAKNKDDRPRNFKSLCRLIQKLIVDKDSPDEEYKKNLEAHLAKEQRQIEEEKIEIADKKRRASEERKRIETERRRIKEERKRMAEQQKKISKQKRMISAEYLRFIEEKRQQRKEKFIALCSATYGAFTNKIARKIYKTLLILSIITSAGFLVLYLYHTGVISTLCADAEEVIRKWRTIKTSPEPYAPNDPHERGVVELWPLANQEILDWLKKNNEIKIKGKKIGTVVSHLPGSISLPAGDYSISIEILGCATVNKEFSKTNDSKIKLDIPIIPTPGKITISCNAKDFKVLEHGEWVNKTELQIPALVPYDLLVKADGFRGSITQNIMLTPGESKDFTVILEHKNGSHEDFRKGRTGDAIAAFNEGSDSGYSKAFNIFGQEAANENPVAAYYLGMMYERGLGQRFHWANPSEAEDCYEFAVAHDVPDAFYKMGMIYEAKDSYVEAFKQYVGGAELGNLPCFKKIGEYYLNGIGECKKNLLLAYHYLLVPGKYGDADAQLLLGKICESEDLTLHNLKQAKFWYEEAIKNGKTEAKIFLEQVKDSMENL